MSKQERKLSALDLANADAYAEIVAAREADRVAADARARQRTLALGAATDGLGLVHTGKLETTMSNPVLDDATLARMDAERAQK